MLNKPRVHIHPSQRNGEIRKNDLENIRHHNNSSDSRPQRWRKDSTTSVGSRNSDAYRTPFVRQRTESGGEKKHNQHSSSNAFSKISQLDLNGLVRKPVERSLEQFGYVEGAD